MRVLFKQQQADIQEGDEESVLSTQEYIRKVVKDVSEDEDFKVVAIIKSCTLNALGDLTMTLKDISGTIHYKVLNEGVMEKDITLGASLILQNVLSFSPKPSIHYLNITMRNLVKVFPKDTVLENGK
ncbi:AAA+ ATPase domain-containing protein, partial [Tanacetum coccineum]